MGQFSNGTDGEIYYSKWCERCVHDNPDTEDFCTVWNMHLMGNESRDVLDQFIPVVGGDNKKCVMFHEATVNEMEQVRTIKLSQHIKDGRLVF